MNWLVVTPALNEATRLPGQARSLAAQTVPPGLWVVVDDGSTDGTATCVDWSALPFPAVVLRRDNTGGLSGASELLAFRAGVDHGLTMQPDAERIMKLDADLELAADYLELLAPAGPEIGLIGGQYLGPGELSTSLHVRGGLRAYSPAAYDLLRALPPALGWDAIDEVAIRQAGLQTVMDPRACATASRTTGASRGLLRGRYRKGVSSRWSGYHPAYALLQCVLYLARPPYLVGGLALGWGYVSSGRGPFAAELRAAHRAEQRQRLRELGRNPLGWLLRSFRHPAPDR